MEPDSRIVHLAPLAPAAVGLAVGIVVERWLAMPLWVPVAGLVVVGVALWVLLRLDRRWSAAVVLAMGGVCVGAGLHHVHYRRFESNHIVLHVPAEQSLVRLRGQVASTPVTRETSAGAFERWLPRRQRTRFLLAAEQLIGSEGELPVAGLVHVSVGGWLPGVSPGQQVELTGWLYRPMGPANPGQFDWQTLQRRQRVLVGLSVEQADCVRVVADDAGLATWRHWFRTRCREYLFDKFGSDEATSTGLLEAMLLGQRSGTARETDEAFVRTGTAHLLSVSGIHVGLLAVFGWWVSSMLGLSPRACAAVVLVLVLAYVGVAEPRAPILRAGILAVLGCFAVMLHRPSWTANWLAAGAIVILTLRPTDLFGAGFQLSFGVVCAVIYLSPRLSGLLLDRRRSVERLMVRAEDEPWWRVGGRSVWRTLLLGLGVAVAAWLTGSPLVAHHFGRWSPLGWLNSLLVGPLAGLVMFVGFGKLLLAAVWPSTSVATGPVLSAVTGWLHQLVSLLSQAPLCSMTTPPPPAVLLVGWYAVLATWMSPWPVSRRLLRLAGATVLVAWVAWLGWPRHDAETLRMGVLSVGHGSATVLQLPNGQTLLCDAGSLGSFDVGGGTIVPALHAMGVRRIDAAVVSHPDLDHFSGLLDVADRVPVRRVMVSPYFDQVAQAGSPERFLLDELGRRGVETSVMQAGDRLSGTGGVTVRSLWPPLPTPGRSLTDNDASIVLRVEYAGRSILLTGDIDEWTQAVMLRSAELQSDVLLVPHHGSVKPMTAPFVQAIGATHLIRSAGRRSSGSEAAWAEIAAGKGVVHSTVADGCVSVAIGADGGVVVQTFLPKGPGTR